MEPFSPSPGTGDLYENPRFVNAGLGNFSLMPTSSLIGAAENSYDMGAVPYTVRPIMPTDLNITPQPGEFTALLTWTNPLYNSDGSSLTSLSGVKIYRNGTLITTLSGQTPGGTGQFTDTVPVQGNYRYKILAFTSLDGLYSFTKKMWVGPPAYAEIPFDWVEISGIGTNTGIVNDDQNAGPFNIGFNFPWYDGTYYNSIRICSNGFASFTSSSAAYTNEAIPSPNEPNNIIAPLWDDLYPPGGEGIWCYFDAVNNRFIIEWNNILSYASPRTPQKFELILYPNGNVDFMYEMVQAPCSNANTAGIENASGTEGVSLTFNGSGPWEPRSERGVRIFAVGAPPPVYDVDVTMTPYGAPIQIPASGGSFSYNIALTNNEAAAVTCQVWCNLIKPNGAPYGPTLGPVTVTLNPGATINRDRNQNIPGWAPAGNYTYNGFVGNYPDQIWSTDSFPFTKLATGLGDWVDDWDNTGESLEISLEAATPPDCFALGEAFPNPFNPTTAISYQLPDNSLVHLRVYDTVGRLVATLVEGWRQAGMHEVTFDGSGLASGIYLAVLQAGEFSAVQKLLMVK